MGKKFKGTYFISSISLTSAIAEFGITSIFTLFLLYVLHFSIPLASQTYAVYFGFAYILPIFVGYYSDRYLKKSTALTIGLILMIISQFILSFASMLYTPSDTIQETLVFNLQNTSFFVGLVFLAFGTSFSNLIVTNIINSLNDEKTVTDAFSIYYPILNLGVVIGVLVMTLVIGDDHYYLYKWAFLVFGFCLIIGLIFFRLFKNKYLIDYNGNLMKDESSPNSIKAEINKAISKISSKTIAEIGNLNFKEKRNLFKNSITPHEKDRMIVFLVFVVLIIFYRIAYSQNSISLVFFIDNFVQRDLGWFDIPVQLFFVLEPLYILILGPALVKFNNKLEEKNIEFGFIKRTLAGMLILSSCYLLLAVVGYFIDINVLDKINLAYILIFEFLFAISELSMSLAGYSMMGNLAPEKYYSFLFGIFLATRAVSMFISGNISALFPAGGNPSFYGIIPINGLMVYYLFFVVVIIIAAFTLFIFRNKLIKKMHLDDFNQN